MNDSEQWEAELLKIDEYHRLTPWEKGMILKIVNILIPQQKTLAREEFYREIEDELNARQALGRNEAVDYLEANTGQFTCDEGDRAGFESVSREARHPKEGGK